MFANLLSIQNILKAKANPLDAFLHLGFQYPDRVFYQGPHGTVTYLQLSQLTQAQPKTDTGTLMPIASAHPAHFFASYLKALMDGKLPLLFSHKYDEVYKAKLLSAIAVVDDMPGHHTPMTGVFTSGTSGTPKAVLHGLEGLLWNVLGVLTRWQEELDWRDDFIPTFGLVLPWHHFGGFMVLLRAFLLNAQVIHVERAEEFALRTHVDVASVVPTQMSDIIQALNGRTSLTSHFLVGGAASQHLAPPPSLGLSLSLSYGLTETGGTVAATSFGGDRQARPYPYRQLESLPDHQFAIFGPTVALGYFQDKIWHAFDRSLVPPDSGTFNPSDGSLTILGRRDQVIICGGENIDLAEVLATLPGPILLAAGCTVTALPDERLGQIPVLFFTDSKFENQISQALQKLPSFKRPRKIIPFPPNHRIKGIKPSQQELVQWVTEYEKFRFEHWGNPTGPKILALHGFMGSPLDFHPIATRLSQFHWIVPYLPGHGTPIGQFHHFEHGCEMLVQWYQALFPKVSFSLLGYSMGGRIALGMVEQLLKKDLLSNLNNLILLSTGPGNDDEEKNRQRCEQDATLNLNFITQQEKRNFLHTWYSGSMWGNLNRESGYDSLVNKRLETPHQEWSMSMRMFGQGTHASFKQTLLKLSQQHLGRRCYCFGGLDSKYKKFALDYQNLGFATEEFSNLGHALLEEAPETLADFLRALELKR